MRGLPGPDRSGKHRPAPCALNSRVGLCALPAGFIDEQQGEQHAETQERPTAFRPSVELARLEERVVLSGPGQAHAQRCSNSGCARRRSPRWRAVVSRLPELLNAAQPARAALALPDAVQGRGHGPRLPSILRLIRSTPADVRPRTSSRTSRRCDRRGRCHGDSRLQPGRPAACRGRHAGAPHPGCLAVLEPQPEHTA